MTPENSDKPPIPCVLLIDDNEMDNEFHTIMIEETNLVSHVLSALDGEEGLKVIKETAGTEKEPTLIFLDINMPGMDGFEFLEIYKNLSSEFQLDSTILLMLTTSLMDQKRFEETCIPQLKGYLHKPLTSDKFRNLIAHHLGRA